VTILAACASGGLRQEPLPLLAGQDLDTGDPLMSGSGADLGHGITRFICAGKYRREV
jgi:hypothetical protein